ncbi:MAG TPA: NAD(P)/FAD-dependent oxidoreductase [Ohtaekwangia sp.]
MKRRDFITRAGWLAALPFLSAAALGKSSVPKKVLIIGAGMAGAAAARKLKDRGCEVTLLEARNRTGGRIHTHRDWGYPVELGANWIHDAGDTDNPLLSLAEKLDISIRKTNFNSIGLFDLEGNTVNKIAIARFYLQFNKAFKQGAPELLVKETDASLAEMVDYVTRDKKYSEKEKAILALITEGMANTLGTALDNGSAKYYLTQPITKAPLDFLVTGGYQRVVDYLLRDIPVELNTVVREIRTDNERLEIITEQTTYPADFVIVTVPISILQQQRIIFSPALPHWKINSFSKMQLGLFNKVVMEFHSKFWKGDKHFYMHNTSLGNAFGGALNYDHYLNKPVLISMPVDRSAKWVEENDTETIQATWKEILHKAHRGKEIEFKNILVTRWQGDDYARGSYSHVPVGSVAADFEALQQEVGRIHFAGEATQVTQHGTVQGAYNSGVREAMKILSM